MDKFIRITDTHTDGASVDLSGKTPTVYTAVGYAGGIAIDRSVYVTVATAVAISGIIAVSYDPSAYGNAIVIIDCGDTSLAAGDRYREVDFEVAQADLRKFMGHTQTDNPVDIGVVLNCTGAPGGYDGLPKNSPLTVNGVTYFIVPVADCDGASVAGTAALAASLADPAGVAGKGDLTGIPAGVLAACIAAGLAEYVSGSSGPLRWTAVALELGSGLSNVQDAKLTLIASRVSTSPIVLRSLVDSSGEMRLNQYADYNATLGNAIQFANNGAWGNCTGAVVHLLISQVSGGVPVGVPTLDVVGTIDGTITNPDSITFSLTHLQTAALTSLEPRGYQYECWLVFAAGQKPIVQASDCTALWGRPTT